MYHHIKNLFQADFVNYEGVRRINIYLMRLLYVLMFLFLGKDAWTAILTHNGAWTSYNAMVWSVWAAFATLAGLGILHPLKMIPILLLEIFYKVLWLILVAYPLIKADKLAGSSAEEMTYVFLPVLIPIVAIPWAYTFRTFVLKTRKA